MMGARTHLHTACITATVLQFLHRYNETIAEHTQRIADTLARVESGNDVQCVGTHTRDKRVNDRPFAFKYGTVVWIES
jgi:hypothetical protein